MGSFLKWDVRIFTWDDLRIKFPFFCLISINIGQVGFVPQDNVRLKKIEVIVEKQET